MTPIPLAFTEIATAAILASGGTFQPVLCPDQGIAHWLADWLRSQGWEVHLHLPMGEGWHSLPHALLNVPQHGRVLHIVYGNGPATPQFRLGLAGFNLRRDRVLSQLPNLLIWAGPQRFLDESEGAMPDVWSMRDTTLRITLDVGPMPLPLRTWFLFREDNLDRLRDATYDAIRRGDPAASGLSLRLSEGHAAVGDIANARRLALELRRRDPECDEAAVLLAELLLVEQEAIPAERAVDHVLRRIGPENPQPALGRRIAMVRATAAMVRGEPNPMAFEALKKDVEAAGDVLGAARAQAAAGDALAMCGTMAAAEQALRAAMDTFRRLGEREWEAAAAHAVGDVLGHQYQSVAAQEFYQLALALRLPPDPPLKGNDADATLTAVLTERFSTATALRRLCLEAGIVLPQGSHHTWRVAVDVALREGRIGTLRRVAGLDIVSASKPDPTRKPNVYIPYPSLGAGLIGRAEGLNQLRQALDTGATTRLGQVVAVVGLGGLGKTQLVSDYAAQWQKSYPGGIYWFEADADIDGQLGQLSARAGWTVPEAESSWKIQTARERLRVAEDMLLIFDNVEDLRRISDILVNGSTRRHIILVSRAAQPGFSTLPIGPLREEDAALLLQRTSRRSQDGAAALLGLLGGHPLMLEMVGVWLRDHPQVSWADSTERILREGLQAPELAGEGHEWASPTGHSGNLRATLQIRASLLARPGCAAVVDLLAWSAPVAMGLELMCAALGVERATLQISLDELALAQVIRSEQGGRRWGMHRLVAAVRREDAPLNPETAKAQLTRIVHWFRARKEDWRDLALFEAELDHLVAWRGLASSFGCAEAEVCLWWLAAYPSYHRGKSAETKASLAEAWRLYQVHQLQIPLLEADLCLDRGWAATALGRYSEGLQLSTRALGLRVAHLAPDDLEIARARMNLGNDLCLVGRVSEGVPELRTAWAILLRSEPFDAIWAAMACNALTGAVDLSEAKQIFMDGWPKIRAALGDKHPQAIYCRICDADIALRQGRHHKAAQELSQLVQDAREILGARHPITGNCLYVYGIALANNQERPRAVEVLAEALHIRLEACGGNEAHLIVTSCRKVLATVLHHLKRPSDALKILNPALKAHPPGTPEYESLQKVLALIQPRLPSSK